MAMLLAFVLFGAVLSGILGMAELGPALILAALVIFVIRPAVLGLVLSRARMSFEAHAFVGWFGPRGLNSLLLALLVVLGDVPNGELLLATVGIVVLSSIVVHGASAPAVSGWYSRRAAEATLAEERESTAAGLFDHVDGKVPRITPDELNTQLQGSDPPIVLDVRTRSSYERDETQIPGSVRVLPDEITDWTADQPGGTSVVVYCT